MKNLIFLAAIVSIVSCTGPSPTAQEVVDKAIESSGTSVLQNGTATFTFRKVNYEYERKNGAYSYARIQQDAAGVQVKDILKNDGFIRTIANEKIDLTNEKRLAYTASVNSVVYFAFLPLWLNDEAVYKSYEGITKIEGTTYHKVKVTFNPKGGGEDFEDVFYYWFDTKDYSTDYIAYSYNEEHGTGMRFRAAYNPRTINGVTIQDYRNMKPRVKDRFSVDQLDSAYINNELEELSLIELKNMKITPHK